MENKTVMHCRVCLTSFSTMHYQFIFYHNLYLMVFLRLHDSFKALVRLRSLLSSFYTDTCNP